MAPREEPRTVYPSRTGVKYGGQGRDVGPGDRAAASVRDSRTAAGRAPNRLGRVAHRIYICSAEGNTGKSTVALGALDTLARRATRVGVFRPISRSTEDRDYVLDLLLAHDGVVPIEYEEAIGVSYDEVHADPDQALATIVRRFKAVEDRCDAVVIIGSDFTDVGSPTELGYNARIAANLGAPVLLVLGGRVGQGRGASERLGHAEARTPDELAQLTELAIEELAREHATLLGVVVNRADPERLAEIVDVVGAAARWDIDVVTGRETLAAASVAVWAIPEDPYLVAPSMRAIMEAVDGKLYAGDPDLLDREALGVVIAAMSMENVLTRLIEGSVVVVPGDRSEVLLGVLTAHASATFPSISGIVLNGGFPLSDAVERLIDGLKAGLPIIRTQLGSYDTALAITQTRGRLAAESQRKRDTALSLFERHVDGHALLDLLDVASPEVVTPLMFEYGLLERARRARKHIVLPEGYDDRILRAAATLLARDVADLTILGEEIEIRSRAIGLGLDISRATVLSNHDHVLVYRFADEYHRRRAHKGITLEQARETVQDVSYFGTMMVALDLADGMVSGAVHTTAHTIRPGVRDHQDEARRRASCRACSSWRSPTACSSTATARSCRCRPPSSSPTSRSRRRRPPRSSASSRAWPCCRTRRASRARAPTSTRCGAPPSSCANAPPSSPSRGRSSTTRPPTPPSPARSSPSPTWRAARRCSSSPTSTPATTPTRPCSARRAPSRSARCCRASTSPSTTSRAGRSCRTS